MDLGFGQSGFKRGDHAFVGMPAPGDATFAELFATQFQPRLERRQEGFAALFAALTEIAGPKLILETGTLRIPGNWGGDGQSTYMFDQFVQSETASGRVAALFSIDVSLESLAVARRACSFATNLILNDSVHALHTLARQVRGRQGSLLYLDSFNFDSADPLPSARHHMMELTAAAPLLDTGSLVAIDDYEIGGASGGKGMLVDLYMHSIDAPVIYSGYQKIWRMP
jgi:hypothetical protein